MDQNNPVVTNFITRAEYEARQSEVMADIHGLETKIDGLSSKIDTKFETISQKIDSNNNRISSLRTGIWRYVATSLLSVIMGGATYALGEFLIMHHF